MNTSRCHYMLYGCFVAIEIRWSNFADFVSAREELAKRLGAEFLYSEELLL